MAQLLLIGLLLLLTAPCTTPRTLAAGLLCGLIVANRPPDVVLVAALGIYALFWAGRRLTGLVVSTALPVALMLFYNFSAARHIGGGYGLIGDSRFFDNDPLAGIAGLLFSPTRGLFVFSPFLLFLFLAWRHWPRARGERGLTLAIGIAFVIQVLLYAKTDWRGGISWGPRFMTDVLPLLLWALVPVVSALRNFGRVCFALTVVISIAIEAIGAFCYTGETDAAIYAVSEGPDRLRAAWQWKNAPFIASWKKGIMPAEFTKPVRGSFDAITVEGRADSVVVAGQEAVATGWALAGPDSPWRVDAIIDGRQVISTSTFFERGDVRATLHEASPAGWHVPLDTAGLTPGEHAITVLVWVSDKAEGYYLDERTLTVREPSDESLKLASQKAAERIREHQQTDGYWLTSFTSETRFHEPRPEMNTFLTALMLDVLAPVARDNGLEENVQRARSHLTRQIEPGGLVRYHGLPDAPNIIGTLGCAITPDTDDTALVWRLAPAPDRARLASALATIDRYRTSEGLYRTWLAQPDGYQCLNPGRDPNPPDIAIQMHLLLLLAEARPSAGDALCNALRPVVNQDRVWVYYRKAPLVPMLRMPDVQQAGCDLQLPKLRMRTEVPGQEIWISLVQLLGSESPDKTRVRSVLHELARNEFALLRTNPPLLYHNDLTATVSRYYWSEDAGYALWLRLHDKL
jgi:hypothetical protein